MFSFRCDAWESVSVLELDGASPLVNPTSAKERTTTMTHRLCSWHEHRSTLDSTRKV